MRPKLPPDPGNCSHKVIYKDDDLALEKLIRLARVAFDPPSTPSPERQKRLRAAEAATTLDRLHVEDLDPELQVDLFNRLVELLAAK